MRTWTCNNDLNQKKQIIRVFLFIFVSFLGNSCKVLPALDTNPIEFLSALRVLEKSKHSQDNNSQSNNSPGESSSDCTSNCSTDGSVTVQINYVNSPFSLTTGVSSLNESPVLSGNPTYFTVSPDLPFGLKLDSGSGSISGTISEAVTNADFTITGTADAKSAQTTIRISSVIPAACADVTITAGVGTLADPFQICNPLQLQSMSTHHISNPGSYYQLTQDIDLSSISNFTPISNITNQFTGVFDGQNHTVHNLTIDNNATSQQGLFGYVVGGATTEIRNLRLSNANVRGNAQSGSVIGLLNAYAKNIHSYGAVVDGFADGTGGLVGRFSGVGSIYDSSFSGTVVGGGSYTGGIVGDSFGGDEVVRCKGKGTITGNGAVGGIIGRAAGTLVLNSYWMGSVTGITEVGGIMGKGQLTDGKTKFSYSVGSVTGTSSLGGLIGSITSSSEESYYNIDVANQADNDTRGIPKTTTQLKCPVVPNDSCATTAIYTSWDTTIWNFGTALDYPKLKWENTL